MASLGDPLPNTGNREVGIRKAQEEKLDEIARIALPR